MLNNVQYPAPTSDDDFLVALTVVQGPDRSLDKLMDSFRLNNPNNRLPDEQVRSLILKVKERLARKRK